MGEYHPGSPMERVVAKALIFEGDGRFLVVRRSMTERRRPGALDLPGGTAIPDESPVETVAREVREEVHLRIDPTAFCYCFEKKLKTEHPDRVELMRWIGYAARIPASQTPSIEGNSEHSGLYRMTQSEFLAASDDPVHIEFVNQAFVSGVAPRLIGHSVLQVP